MTQSHDAPGAGCRMPKHAARIVEGESLAAQYLARLQAQQVQPDELALIVAMLYGEALRGFCSAIQRAIGGKHG